MNLGRLPLFEIGYAAVEGKDRAKQQKVELDNKIVWVRVGLVFVSIHERKRLSVQTNPSWWNGLCYQERHIDQAGKFS